MDRQVGNAFDGREIAQAAIAVNPVLAEVIPQRLSAGHAGPDAEFEQVGRREAQPVEFRHAVGRTGE